MYSPEEILTSSLSSNEMERRWSETRKRMEEESIDILLMQNDNQWMGGYVRWFTDIPARDGYPITVIFPIDDEMTTITCGGKPPGDLGPPAWQ